MLTTWTYYDKIVGIVDKVLDDPDKKIEKNKMKKILLFAVLSLTGCQTYPPMDMKVTEGMHYRYHNDKNKPYDCPYCQKIVVPLS